MVVKERRLGCRFHLFPAALLMCTAILVHTKADLGGHQEGNPSHIVCRPESEPSFWPSDRTPDELKQAFFREADFGYVEARAGTLKTVCGPSGAAGSSSHLDCTRELEFCSGTNVMIDFANVALRRAEMLRYDTEVLKEGRMMARCQVNESLLADNTNRIRALQSWAPEVRYLVGIEEEKQLDCDVVVREPVFVMKIDAPVNMYHHFCDFFNLFASLHLLHRTRPDVDAFSRDVRILVWENIPYRSAFAQVFEAFSRHPVWDLTTFSGRKVCFRQVVFPLLPRMMYGLYYNTPLSTSTCSNSSLFNAFSRFITRRLRMDLPLAKNSRRLRVIILNRATPHRNILNLDDLVKALKATGRYSVTVATFTHRQPPFLDQMKLVRSTDVLVGMHGAGLTHMLFLPDWGAVFELYNCGDPGCYHDLARLRGLHYVTWTNESLVYPSSLAASQTDARKGAKFTDYQFDIDEFIRKVDVCSSHVKGHPTFRDADQELPGREEL